MEKQEEERGHSAGLKVVHNTVENFFKLHQDLEGEVGRSRLLSLLSSTPTLILCNYKSV